MYLSLFECIKATRTTSRPHTHAHTHSHTHTHPLAFERLHTLLAADGGRGLTTGTYIQSFFHFGSVSMSLCMCVCLAYRTLFATKASWPCSTCSSAQPDTKPWAARATRIATNQQIWKRSSAQHGNEYASVCEWVCLFGCSGVCGSLCMPIYVCASVCSLLARVVKCCS